MDKYTVTVAYPHWINRVGGDGPGPDDFEVLSVMRDETYESVFINCITNEDTGGGCRVDFIELKDGTLLTLNDEAVCWHKNRESFNEGGDVPTIYFYEAELQVPSGAIPDPVTDAIKKLSDVVDALEGILKVMNVDMDGDYFICSECEPMIEAAKVIARNARKSYLKVRGIS